MGLGHPVEDPDPRNNNFVPGFDDDDDNEEENDDGTL